MKFVIVHANKCYDEKMQAKKGIEELLPCFAPEDIIELEDASKPHPLHTASSNESYLIHKSKKIFYSKKGELKRECVDDLIGEGEKEFVLVGGIFTDCHWRAFSELLLRTKAKEFIFPLKAIYTYNCHNKSKDLIIEMIKSDYSKKAKIFWNKKEVYDGKGDHVIKLFSERKNKKLKKKLEKLLKKLPHC